MFKSLLLTLFSAGAMSASCLTNGADPGCVHFMMRTSSKFDTYTANPSQGTERWLLGHFWRMQVSQGYFDNRLSWFPNAWAYIKTYAISRTNSSLISQHPDWILHNANGTRLYIKWGCQNGSCPQYAGDITNSAFRQWWIQQAKAVVAIGYRGLWMDNVDLRMEISDGSGKDQVPVDSHTGKPVSPTDWERYMAAYLTEIRQTMPNVELLHNSIWYAGSGTPGSDPYVQQEIKAANWINLERGVGDPNITGDGGRWSIQAEFNFMDTVHSLGSNVSFEDYSFDGGDYPVAAYFLISSGRDAFGNNAITPYNWPAVYDVQLGKPSSARYVWNGLLRRDFANGMVLLNPPGRPKVSAPLDGTYTDSNGKSVSSVSLSARQGIVLLGGSPTETSGAVPVRLNSCGRAFGDFGSDQGWDAGKCKISSSFVDLSKVADPAPQDVYHTGRMTVPGDPGFSYTIPNLVSGYGYHVHLDFADPSSSSSGQRQFTVIVNGATAFTNFDIFSAAGAKLRAVSKDIFGVKPDSHNQIVIEFKNGKDGVAIVSGISILP